ncbi:MAG: thioredoxin domain-containing protein [Kordiimonadaceae bacterium]|nr:thioredoxin domain-containing protein [Kordiimonadaceae bacterium]
MYKILSLALASILSYATAVTAQNSDHTPVVVPDNERAKIEQVIQDYLLTNPEILELALRELQRRRVDDQRTQMLDVAENYRGYLETNSNAGVLGNPKGDVTIVEFFDYQCGVCRRHFADVMRLVKEDGNIRWVARHFPILDRPGELPLSQISARAAIAAQKQGKFAAFHTEMMTSPGKVTIERIFKIAEDVGIDVTKMQADMDDVLTDKQITNGREIAIAIGFTGTPGYIIGKNILLGAEGYGAVKRAVEATRRKNAAKQ